jgi:hypothetical protein
MLPQRYMHLNLQLLYVMNAELCIRCLLFNNLIYLVCFHVCVYIYVCMCVCVYIYRHISSTLHQDLGEAGQEYMICEMNKQ